MAVVLAIATSLSVSAALAKLPPSAHDRMTGDTAQIAEGADNDGAADCAGSDHGHGCSPVGPGALCTARRGGGGNMRRRH